MTGMPQSAKHILELTSAVARCSQDLGLVDRITVVRGYAELVETHPENNEYRRRLDSALTALSESTTNANPYVQPLIQQIMATFCAS